MPYGGSGANKAPIGQLNPILLGQKKETGGTSLLAQHLNKKREKESGGQRQPGGFNEGGPWDNQQPPNYRQQGNYNQQGSYNQHQGGFGQQQDSYNQQQGGYNQQQRQQGGYSQQGQYNQQRDYNNQSNYNAPSQNYGDSRQYDNRNQQSRPYNQGPPSQPPSGQAPYNQYQSAPPPSGNQSSSYGSVNQSNSYGSGFQPPPPNFNAPPPNSNMPPVQGFPPSGFAPPLPLPKTSGFNQPPPSFGGPPPPQLTPTNAPPPPAPSSNTEQPPLPATAANRVGREGRESRSSPPKKRKKRSRWGDMEERIQIPGLPSSLPVDATQEQREEYMLHFKIEEISIKLRSGDLGIPENPEDRSPSPEPIYNTEGKRLNTREYRVRKRLEEDRHTLVQQASMKNADYKPPVDYRPPSNRMQEKVMIPQDANPAINFIGLLIGPRGNTLKKMEKDTNCKIIIRGKGSVKEGKVGRPGFPLPGENEPLHALVTGPTVEEVKNAVKVIEKIIKEGVETPEGSNELRKMQLRELAALNGTLIEEDIQRCRNCGATDHRHWECTEVKNITSQIVCTKCGGFGHVANDCTFISSETGTAAQPTIVEKAKMDDEYMSLMAELGVDAPVPKSTLAFSTKQEPTPAPAIAAPPSSSNDQTTSKNGTPSAPWSAPHEPKPLMSVNPTYTPRATPPKPLMSSQAPPPKVMMASGGPPGHGPPGHRSPWQQQRGPPPHDLGAQRPGGPRGPAPPWAQGPGTPSSNMRGPPPAPTGPPTGPPPPGAPPPWQADNSRKDPRIQRKGPPPPWQQTPPPPAAAAPYAPPAGYGVPPRGVMYPQMGQLPPMPPWSAPPPPPPPPS